MNKRFIALISLALSSLLLCANVSYADDIIDDDALVSFPVQEVSKSGAPKAAPVSAFPYLAPLPDTSPKWPPLFPLPQIEPTSEKQLSDMERGPIAEMDALPAPPKIALIIDDVGYNKRGMEESLSLPKPVVLAILPQTPYGKRAAEAAYTQQRIAILHAPMENARELKLGPGGLYLNMDEQTFKQTLRHDLDSVPQVVGVNNHMGSLLTTYSQPMQWVMDVMEERSLFFIDSLTSAKSVAHTLAKQRGIKTVTRDVFLDNVRSDSAINKQFERLLVLAHQHGSAIAIGHPYPETMTYLTHRLAQPLSASLVSIKELLH